MADYSLERVLIIDNYKTMRLILRNMLNQIGIYLVDEAPDSELGLRLIHENSYDLIISDRQMNPISGLEMLKKLRTSESPNTKTPFLMISAQSQTEDIVAACHAGADNYIIKPFSTEVFNNKVSQALELRTASPACEMPYH